VIQFLIQSPLKKIIVTTTIFSTHHRHMLFMCFLLVFFQSDHDFPHDLIKINHHYQQEHAVRPVDYNNINSIEYNHGLKQRHTHMEETQSQSTIGEETHVEAILTPVSTRRIQPTLIEELPVDPKKGQREAGESTPSPSEKFYEEYVEEAPNLCSTK
jgi:hypothetical protein